tara:strand:- start:2516 stop:3460 length:945 start_codon:yes stop_codon:yes gene_type:complete
MYATNKTLEKLLSTGQKIQISQQEEKSLRASYDYLAGFAGKLHTIILSNPFSYPHLLHRLSFQSIIHSLSLTLCVLCVCSCVFVERQKIAKQIDQKKLQLADLQAEVATMSKDMRDMLNTDMSLSAPPSSGVIQFDARTPDEVKLDTLFHTRNEIASMETSLQTFNSSDPQISIRDIDAMLKHFNASMKRAELEFMIWEVNDTGSGKIGWDEYQLAFYRKVIQDQSNEPEAFLQILEYLLYDMHHNGYILEDDCMEVLYGRHGLSQLQEEMNFLFGNNLRAAGGNGQLCCQDYLNVVATRSGRRALVDGGSTKY